MFVECQMTLTHLDKEDANIVHDFDPHCFVCVRHLAAGMMRMWNNNMVTEVHTLCLAQVMTSWRWKGFNLILIIIYYSNVIASNQSDLIEGHPVVLDGFIVLTGLEVDVPHVHLGFDSQITMTRPMINKTHDKYSCSLYQNLDTQNWALLSTAAQ